MQRAAVTMIAAGAMWVAMAGMAVWGIAKIMEASRQGSRIMRVFGRTTERMMRALGDAFVEIFGPMVKWLTRFMELMLKHPWVLKFAAAIAMVAVAGLAVYGATMLLKGGMELLNLTFGVGAVQALTYQEAMASLAATTHTTTIAVNMLIASWKVIMLGFLLGAQLAILFKDHLHIMIPIILALTIAVTALAFAWKKVAIAQAAATFGLSVVAGIAAMAAMEAAMGGLQYGTRFVQRTGPTIVHAGEAVIPAREAGRGQEVAYAPFPRTTTHVHLSFGTVQTKADKEQLRPLILKTVKEALDNKI